MQGVFDGLGKPDFATAGQLFYRLPADLREGLNRSEERTLVWTIFLAWHTWWHGGRRSVYASYSEAWVGSKFGRSRWTVARAVVKLSGLALIRTLHRRPRPGKVWQTNVYHFGERLLAALSAIRGKSANNSPCSSSAPEESPKRVYKPAARLTGVAAAGRSRYEDPPPTPREHKSESFEEFQARIRQNYTARPHPDR